MVNWAVVAAFIGPLVTVIVAASGFFAYQNRQREKRVAEQIGQATSELRSNHALLQVRIDQMELATSANTKQLEKQNDTLLLAVQAIARIEGRLSGSGSAQQLSLPTCYQAETVPLPTGPGQEVG